MMNYQSYEDSQDEGEEITGTCIVCNDLTDGDTICNDCHLNCDALEEGYEDW